MGECQRICVGDHWLRRHDVLTPDASPASLDLPGQHLRRTGITGVSARHVDEFRAVLSLVDAVTGKAVVPLQQILVGTSWIEVAARKDCKTESKQRSHRHLPIGIEVFKQGSQEAELADVTPQT